MLGDITLRFRGVDYVLPEAKAFLAGEAVEEIATLTEVIAWQRRPQFRKMARCFAAMLNIAGCRADHREVHSEMMNGFKKGDPTAHLQALAMLITVLMDGAPETEEVPAGDGDAGKTAAAS